MRSRLAQPARSAPMLLAAGCTFLVVAAVLWFTASPAAPADVGNAPERAWPTPVALYPSGRSFVELSPGGVPPVQLTLPGSGPARVLPQGLGSRGELGLPVDVDAVGWWSGGAGAGALRGSVVLAGHVDGPGQGVGYLARLRNVLPGERITVRGQDGRVLAYTVTARRSYRKTALPAQVFDRAGPPRLVLITCTGAFDAATRSYEDNLVVFADQDRRP